MSIFYLLLLFFSFFLCNPSPSTAQQQQEQSFSAFNISNSPWTPTQNRILVSSNNRTFAAGFRQLSTSQRLYIFAIWYRNITDRTIVWSLGRNSTFSPSSSLVITPSVALQLNDSTGKNLFPSVAVGKSNSSSLVLQDDGNLVFENWESFNFPTDTFLPNQPMNNNTLVSRNGKYIFNNSKDLIFNETDVYWSIKFQYLDSDGTLVKDNSASWMSADQGASHLRRFTLDDDGNLRVYSLDPSVNDTWRVVWKAVQEPCTIYGTCGPNSICMGSERNSPYCVCPPGFQNITGECKRKIPFTGPEDSKFLRLDYVNFSGGSNQTDRQALNFTVCESGCLANPSCLGFGYKFTGKQYCVHQLDRLLYGYWSPATETAMFLRVAKTETDESNFTGISPSSSLSS
uniref:non-specific serine/threonine protein kinase n=1 Tax=Nelumbo nucifera TaxID=4432 RepID=A0A822ZNH9_NELNU|nr:TPA_asm: hypothetical protein HUJ06_001578 [Nelumbo nucifera]